MIDCSFKLREKLRHISSEHIVVTDYAQRRAAFRQINMKELVDNLLNPINLSFAEEQHVHGEQRFNCYFTHKRRAERCIITFGDGSLRIINVIKLKQSWQKILANKKS